MARAAIFTVVGLAFATASLGNVAPNPGFENVNPDGTVEGVLNAGALFKRDPTGGIDGSAALMYENSDPKAKRVLPAIPLPLDPGKAYSISFKVRCENLTGGRAAFCLEWDGPDGKWDNGVYGLKHISGTVGWTHMEAVTPRPGKGRRNFRFSPGVSGGSVGKVWFDDLVIKPLPPRPIESVYCDVYRNIAPDGEVKFYAALNAADISGGVGSAECSFTFAGVDGKRFSRKVSIEDDRIAVSVPVTSLAAGHHPVVAVVRGTDGVEYRDRLYFTRGDPGKRRVYIDRHRRTIVDGKPFFPLGMYWLDVSDEDLELYSKGPFNCLKTYVRHGVELLDRCEKRGIKVLVSAGVYAKRGNVKTVEEENFFVSNVVSYAKNHPATLAYYVNDENPLSWRDDLVRRQTMLSELDPGDPLDVFVMCSQPIEKASLVRCYPIGVIKMIDGNEMDAAEGSRCRRHARDLAGHADLRQGRVSSCPFRRCESVENAVGAGNALHDLAKPGVGRERHPSLFLFRPEENGLEDSVQGHVGDSVPSRP